jgi:hypothetical protein
LRMMGTGTLLGGSKVTPTTLTGGSGGLGGIHTLRGGVGRAVVTGGVGGRSTATLGVDASTLSGGSTVGSGGGGVTTAVRRSVTRSKAS